MGISRSQTVVIDVSWTQTGQLSPKVGTPPALAGTKRQPKLCWAGVTPVLSSVCFPEKRVPGGFALSPGTRRPTPATTGCGWRSTARSRPTAARRRWRPRFGSWHTSFCQLCTPQRGWQKLQPAPPPPKKTAARVSFDTQVCPALGWQGPPGSQGEFCGSHTALHFFTKFKFM